MPDINTQKMEAPPTSIYNDMNVHNNITDLTSDLPADNIAADNTVDLTTTIPEQNYHADIQNLREEVAELFGRLLGEVGVTRGDYILRVFGDMLGNRSFAINKMELNDLRILHRLVKGYDNGM